MEEARKEDNKQVLKVLEALKQASHDLHNNPLCRNKDSNSSAIKALLELQTEADNILSNDPNLLNLSNHISKLKTLINDLNHHKNHHSLRSYLRRKITSYEISCVASSIETEIQSWIDRETIENLVKSLQEDLADEDEKIKLLSQFEERVSQGFDINLQELILKAKVFSILETILCDPKGSKRVREKSGFVVNSLVLFNKNVFVGEVCMGFTITALISMGSSCSIQVLCSLIKSIRLPLVDEIEAIDGIPKLINLLYSQVELEIKVITLDCLFEIGYYGRKEAIEGMLEMGLVEKLVELQRSELGGDLIEMDCGENEDDQVVCTKILRRKKSCRESRFLEEHPFASCVARFAIQIEVGEGLVHRERRIVKQEIVKRVREACSSDAEAATIVAEVLWGASP